ncbi:MAG: hypothetical protein AB1Y36_00430, partial [Cycloclasticus sp.]
MKKTTLKKQFTTAIVVGCLTFLLVLFGVRMMGKVTYLAYLEREHIVATTNMSNELITQASRHSFMQYATQAA